MLTVPERIGDESEILRKAMNKHSFDLRVCSPGIIQSFNPDTLTCTVQVAIRERINIAGELKWIDIPLLTDVPVMILGTADYFITYPIIKGTECLIVFGDNCMDAWWQSGGVQNQIEKRRHDLSDGYVIVGIRSQANLISNYSTEALEIRNKTGNAKIQLSGTNINIQTAGTINIGSGDVVINNRNFLNHKHSGVLAGGGESGGVV